MKKLIAKKWVKELRSGRWEQGLHALCSIEEGNKCYCCLGVLTELYNIEQIKKRKKKLITKDVQNRCNDGKDVIAYKSGEDSWNEDTLPTEVMKWSGIIAENGSLLDANLDVDYESLADMNDSGKSFNFIADIIEKHYESL